MRSTLRIWVFGQLSRGSYETYSALFLLPFGSLGQGWDLCHDSEKSEVLLQIILLKHVYRLAPGTCYLEIRALWEQGTVWVQHLWHGDGCLISTWYRFVDWLTVSFFLLLNFLLSIGLHDAHGPLAWLRWKTSAWQWVRYKEVLPDFLFEGNLASLNSPLNVGLPTRKSLK